MLKYSWRPGSRFGVEASVAAEALEVTKAKNGGVLRPEDVVEDNREESAPLHSEFDWDDAHAAQEHRKSQARQLIRSIEVLDDKSESKEPQIAYVSVQREEEDRGYRPTVEVMSDDDLRDQALADCLSLLKGVRRRYEKLEALAEVWKAMDEAEERSRKPAKPKKTRARAAAHSRKQPA